MRRIYAFLFLCVCSIIAFSSAPDSLLRLLSVTKTDTARISLLFQIEAEYAKRDADSGMYYLQQCKVLMDKTRDTTHEFNYYFEMVLLYHAKAEYEKALQYSWKIVNIAKEKKNKQLEATAYRALFNMYHNLKQFDLAVKYGLYAAHLSESIGDTLHLAINYGNLCWLFEDINQYQKAIYYGQRGIEAGRKYNDVRGLLISLNNTALAYGDINNCYKAIELYKEQLALAKKENIPRSVHKALTNLCLMYAQLGDKDNVLLYAKEYNNFISNNHVFLNSRDKTFTHIVNANLFLYENKLQVANQEVNEGISIAENDSVSEAYLQLYQLAANIQFALHDYKMGAYYLSKWDSVNQLEFNDELANLSMDIEARYQTQKKENEILKQQQLLKRRNIWIIVLIGSVLALVIISLLLYRFLKQRNVLLEKEKIIQEQKIAELKKENQLRATETILKGQEEERSRIAKDLHDGLGGLLSGVKYSLNTMKENMILTSDNAQSLERTVDMLDSGIKELRRVAHNMMPENLIKFGLDTALRDYCESISKTGKIAVMYNSFGMDTYTADNTINITVYRVIQELINNVMKHANATECIVQLDANEHGLHITVEDNGIGFDTNNLNTFKGAGWTNIQNRINYLRGKIQIDSSAQQGTSVQIEIPLT